MSYQGKQQNLLFCVAISQKLLFIKRRCAFGLIAPQHAQEGYSSPGIQWIPSVSKDPVGNVANDGKLMIEIK